MSGRTLALVAVSIALGGPAMAQGGTPSPSVPPAASASPRSGQQGGSAQPDRDFLSYVAQDNQGEIQLCLLAEKKARNPALKAFARLMVDDHVQIESQLAALAGTMQVTLPNDVGEESRRTLAQLEPQSGDVFDRNFLDHQVDDHGHDLDRFRKEADATRNGDVKHFAEITMPILRQHLELAKAVQARIGGG